MRQFLTPEVWKQVKQAASQHGCRGVRWTLQPLIMIAAIMTWCAGETDADRFVLSRSFYVQVHCPKRQRPGKAFSGFCKAMLRLPMPVWWAFCDAVRSRVFHLLADRMTMEGWLPLGCDGSRMECPRTAELEQSLGKSSKDKSAPTLWVIALVSLTTGVLWSWRLGTSKTGERRYLIDLLETLPQAVLQSVLLVCDAGYVGYDLFGLLLKQQCSFLIRLSSQAQLYSLEMVKVEGFTEGEFWYWTDDAENKSKPALRVRVIRVAARKRKNDVWLVTNVLDPKRLPAELAARFYRMRWESEVCQADCVSRYTLYRPRAAAHSGRRGAVGTGTMEPAAPANPTKEDRHATPHRATVSPPGPDDPARPVRLTDLWGKLPDRTRRDTAHDPHSAGGPATASRPLAEPEVPHEGR